MTAQITLQEDRAMVSHGKFARFALAVLTLSALAVGVAGSASPGMTANVQSIRSQY